MQLLGALSTAGRFSLTLTLMGPGPKKVGYTPEIYIAALASSQAS